MRNSRGRLEKRSEVDEKADVVTFFSFFGRV